MKKYMFLSLILSCCLGFAGCSDDDEPGTLPGANVEISVSPAEINMGFEGGTETLTVTANAEWGVYATENWCKCSQTGSVEGNTALKIKVEKNSSMEERTATLVLKSGTYRKEITVKQAHEEVKPDDEIIVPEGYALAWHDEFNDARLDGGKPAMPSTSDWYYETGDNGWGNNELQNYVAGVSGTDTCAVVSDGTLKIIAKKKGKEVISIRMNTNQSWTYGYFEARLKLPVGKGTWPAFWMMPKHFTSWPGDGEIDIMEEVGYRPNWVSSTIHCNAYNHSIGTQQTAEKLIPTAQTDFHVYALEWTEDFIKGYIDGECYFTFNNDKAGNKDTWPFDVPFYLKLNLAWGGNWGGAQGIDESALPATYEIDYVRVFQKK